MTDIDWKARAEAAEARVKELESRLTVTDEMVEKAAVAVYHKFEELPLYAQKQMNGHIATDLARAALTAALEGKT